MFIRYTQQFRIQKHSSYHQQSQKDKEVQHMLHQTSLFNEGILDS